MCIISQEDQVTFLNYINKYAGLDGACCTHDANFDPLAAWRENKSHLFQNLFHGNLILERNITYSIPTETLANSIESDEAYQSFRWQLIDKMSDAGMRYSSAWYAIKQVIAPTQLAENKLSEAREIKLPNGTKVNAPKGIKPNKVIKPIADYFGLGDLWEKVRIAVSQILNDKSTSGTLCLSIHPMDYVTMSDNTYKWSSCMSWINEGCYRSGTLEMLNSPKVIVAYLRGDKPFEDGISNKKWRTLIIVDDKVLTTVKSYPYQSEELSTAAIEWVRSLITDKEYRAAEPYTYGEVKMRCSTHGHMYNDFGSATHYGCFAPDYDPYTTRHDIDYGATIYCLNCGEVLDNDCDDAEMYLVHTESNYYVCEHCDERIYNGDYYCVDGDILCLDCIDELCFYCELTCEYHYYENGFRFNINGDSHMIYNTGRVRQLIFVNPNSIHDGDEVTADQLTERGRRLYL